ncbi:iron complex transport system ATP-binding protein [Pollutimonas bauzanensis]|uniref:Iron complex transport system ATP-binding protein n=2 Tax=Pollutimonas bauzanensis TaxID=658167 RepID=A0A1M5S8L0_9BURK|nr:iron complex transport system ATP-binding protein [Pollutimonas bauzanensis]
MFELDALSFTVSGRPLLKPLSLDIPAGKVVGLIGHNGSGKSTLIKILARQQAATGGQASLDGKALASWSDRDFARRVAYLPQQLPPVEGLTVRELVGYGRYPWHGALGRFGDEDHAAIARAMKRADVDQYADRWVDSLSGGERQRVWLAMLLAQDSRYLLLDEPTSALDIAHQVDVLALVRTLSRDLGLGVLVVLHDINMAARYCDHLVALHSGELLAQGSPAELLRSDTLESIYGIPMGVIAHPQDGSALSYVR